MKNRFAFPQLLLFPLVAALMFTPGVLSAQAVHACVVMPPPPGSGLPDIGIPSEPPVMINRAVALGRPGSRVKSYFWPNGSTLRVKFIGGTSHMREQVVRYAREWSRHANIDFNFVTSGSSDIRVSFVRNGSSWATLGSQAASVSENRATMNFGWFTDQTPDYEYRRTILHEFGHALGLLHEHQNPSGGIPWNEEAVYAFYLRTQGWNRQTTHQNVIARQKRDETQYSAYDAGSIMHYPVSPQLTRGGYEVGMNTAISPTDAAFIGRMYPGRSARPVATSTKPPQPTRPPTTTTADRPTPAPTRPVATAHEVTISNQLGKGARSEVVELYLGGKKFTFRLREGQRNRQSLRLRMRPGTYDYRVRTTSVYVGSKRVWDGRRYVLRNQEQTVYGDGTGRFTVSGDDELIFYGEYDRQRRRMRVRLGKRDGGLAAVRR